jgi:hypothetical protein
MRTYLGAAYLEVLLRDRADEEQLWLAPEKELYFAVLRSSPSVSLAQWC